MLHFKRPPLEVYEIEALAGDSILNKATDSGVCVEAKKTKEIEVTPEMIEAGVEVLYESGFYDRRTSADRLIIKKIVSQALLQALALSRASPYPKTSPLLRQWRIYKDGRSNFVGVCALILEGTVIAASIAAFVIAVTLGLGLIYGSVA